MVRLIEAAPTWASDRAQGARVLLSAIAAGSLPGSQSQRLSWTWKLARASRETQYRAATAASPAIRDLLRTLASSRGEEHHVRARLLVASLRQAELPVKAAALAAALTHDAIAGRTIELARDELGSDVEVLAAAFASNLPEQKAEPAAKARRPRKKRKDRPAGARQQRRGHRANGCDGDAPATASPRRRGRRGEDRQRRLRGRARRHAGAQAPAPQTPPQGRRRRAGGQPRGQRRAQRTGTAARRATEPRTAAQRAREGDAAAAAKRAARPARRRAAQAATRRPRRSRRARQPAVKPAPRSARAAPAP